jgi:uncharacterized protein YqfB (UPF0267 family)
MKKLILFSSILFLIIILSTRTSYACSCIEYDLDEFLEQDHRILFYGTVEQEITNKKVIFKVKENYSKTPINENILLQTETTMSTACGINFNGYKGRELLIVGSFEEDDTVMTVSSCSIKRIEDGTIRSITFNHETHETTHLNEIKTHINLFYDGEPYGDITANSVQAIKRQAILSTLIPYGIGIVLIGSLTVMIVTFRKRRKIKLK